MMVTIGARGSISSGASIISASCSASCSRLINSLTEYRAHKAFQAGDYKTAEVEYGALLADTAYDVQNNYNIGTTQYKQKKFEDAHQSFNRAVLHATPNSSMHEQALFNRANCLVQKNKLQDAVKDYKKVLQINPENVPAKTNLAIVEKMLKEPEKKDQQQSKDKNKQQKNEPQDKNQQSKDQDGESEQNQSDKQQKDQADQKQNGNNSKSEQQQRDEQQEQQEQEQTKEQQAEKLQKTKNKKSRDNKEQQTKEKQEAQHEKSLKESNENQSTSSGNNGQNNDEQPVELHDSLAQEMMEKPKDDSRLEKRSAVLLDKLDEYEKNIQKKLLQMNVTKQGAQKHGQKNW